MNTITLNGQRYVPLDESGDAQASILQLVIDEVERLKNKVAELRKQHDDTVIQHVAEIERPRAEAQWTGTPVFKVSSRCWDDRGRVFHRDLPGTIVAEFMAADGYVNAKLFCRMFSEAMAPVKPQKRRGGGDD